VVARLHDLRLEPHPEAAVGLDELDLAHVEAELVQPPQARVEGVGVAETQLLLRRQLAPEPSVALGDLGGERGGVPGVFPSLLRFHVEELAEDVLLGDLEVVLALAVRQPRLQLARLRVDEIRGQLPCIAAEEGIRERAVAPEEAGQVQPDEQLSEGVEEALELVGEWPPREREPVREREVQVARDQDVRQLRLTVAGALGDDADRLDAAIPRAASSRSSRYSRRAISGGSSLSAKKVPV
jgi:hypothetical protein